MQVSQQQHYLKPKQDIPNCKMNRMQLTAEAKITRSYCENDGQEELKNQIPHPGTKKPEQSYSGFWVIWR
jgi:hypothetical protein